MARFLTVFLLVALLSAMPASATSLASTTEPVAALTLATADVVVAQSTEAASGLPAQATPPRTLRAHWHVYIAFTVTWLLLFGYAISLGRRFGRLEEEIRQVRKV